MKHHIIVKFTDDVTDKAALVREVRTMFDGEAKPEGVHSYSFVENCVARPNRYDLMIIVHMDADALANWDASTVHHRWKDEFGRFVAAKAIFDSVE